MRSSSDARLDGETAPREGLGGEREALDGELDRAHSLTLN
jgi:hypothetical protein